MKPKNVSLIYIFSFLLIGCNAQHTTPADYRNHAMVSSGIYKKQIIDLTDSIKSFIKSNGGPYYPTENDSLTQIFIDTILYSPKKDKFAVFVITKNSNDKLLLKGNNFEFHFNGHCFIGHLNNLSKVLDIVWVSSAPTFSHYKDFKITSKLMREAYFTKFNIAENNKGESYYKYNFDDIRFWDGPLWNDTF